jgi:hypothetical protein
MYRVGFPGGGDRNEYAQRPVPGSTASLGFASGFALAGLLAAVACAPNQADRTPLTNPARAGGAAGDAGSGAAMGGTPGSTSGDAGPAPGVDAGSAGDAISALAPTIQAVRLPPAPVDLVPLTIVIAGPPGQLASVKIEASIDGGLTFRAAHLRGQTTDLALQPAGAEHVVDWLSIDDVGFHAPRAAKLRITATSGAAASAPFLVDTPAIDNLRAAARHVQSYLVNYGSWDPAGIAVAKRHDLVIVHPTARNLKADLIADLKRGTDPADPADDVIVLCYVSVGQDDRSFGLTDAQALADPRFKGDGTGPRIDPRGPTPASGALTGLDPKGLPSNGGTGWASYYLDDNSVFRSPQHVGDGVPDRSGEFGVFYVNAGDPKWFDVLDARLIDGPDRSAGLRELLTPDHGRGYACDGLFLDTLDTVAPNSYTTADSAALTKFEWTAAGLSRFVARLHETYPGRLLLQNRGLFYFDPRLPHFALTTRGSIDFAFFESYRLGSRPTPGSFHLDNRFNVTPKLMAEANRPDGFTVLSLGYAEGTGLTGATDTLLGKTNVGLDSMLEDIRVAQSLAGFRHYMTNAQISLVNTFVRDHSQWDDTAPPQWTSTYNDKPFVPMVGPGEPTPRIGVQEIVPVSKGLTVRWDVALDMSRVAYAAYYQTAPFDFGADPKLTKATRVVLSPKVPAAYTGGVGPKIYPNEATITGLAPGTRYNVVIRAFDNAAAANEETNRISLSGVAAP